LRTNHNNLVLVFLYRMLVDNFIGLHYRMADNWFGHIDVDQYKTRPVNYLEIGTFYGTNRFSVDKTYGEHPESKLDYIDPWEDYDV